MWYLQLQKRMEEQHELELELVVLKGKLQVMKHLGDDAAAKEKMKDIMKQLREKEGALADINSFDQVLIDMEWQAHTELQEAREVLIEVTISAFFVTIIFAILYIYLVLPAQYFFGHLGI